MREGRTSSAVSIEDPVIREHILRIAGQNGILVAEALKNEKMLEFDIIDKLSGFMNKKEVRRILYLLREGRVANFLEECKKIPGKRNPWIQYRWFLTLDEALFHICTKEEHILNDIHHTLEYEKTNNFYACSERCMKLTFDNAYAVKFKCPVCKKEMSHIDNRPAIEVLKQAMGFQRSYFRRLSERSVICKARSRLKKLSK